MSIAAILALIGPWIGPLLSRLFDGCKSPASGQRTDPRAELLAQRLPGGGYKPQAIKAAIPQFKRAAKRRNRGLHKSDPDRVDINSVDWADAVTQHFDALLALPPKALMTRYMVGLETSVDGD